MKRPGAPGRKQMISCHQHSCPDGKQILTVKSPSVLVTLSMSEDCDALILGAGGAHGWWGVTMEGGVGGIVSWCLFPARPHILPV